MRSSALVRGSLSLAVFLTVGCGLALGIGGSVPAGAGTFNDGSGSLWTVPTGVSVAEFITVGAKGGNSLSGSLGGYGCVVTAAIQTPPGDQFVVAAGTNGGDDNGDSGGSGGTNQFSGGGNTGGNGGTNQSGPSGGGGGATSEIYDSTNFDGNNHNAAISGGGGGAGGGSAGGSACPSGSSGANGAGGSLAGSGGTNANQVVSGGTTDGGQGQNGFPSRSTNGGNGGAGQNSSTNSPGGGGGGAGWYGGGGGASRSINTAGAGGGGGAGASLIAGAATNGIQTFVTDTTGVPSATINWIDISTTSLTDGSVGHSYSDQVAGTFGASTSVSGSNANWSVTPSLPSGLQLNPTTGAISGTPTAASATTNYTFTATWSSGGLLLAQTSKVLSFKIVGTDTPTTNPSGGSGTNSSTTGAGSHLAATGFPLDALLGAAFVGIGAGAVLSIRSRRNVSRS